MKKTLALLCAQGVFLAVFGACTAVPNSAPPEIDPAHYTETEKEAVLLNQQSDLGPLVFFEESSTNGGNYTPGLEYNPEMIWVDEHLTGYFLPYPHNAQVARLGHVGIEGGGYHVYGVKVGMAAGRARQLLEEAGYAAPSLLAFGGLYQEEDRIQFQKQDITVSLTLQPGSDAVVAVGVGLYDPETPPSEIDGAW